MGYCNSCSSYSCGCGVQIPYYEDPCFQENQDQGCKIYNQYSPVLRISTGWAVPLASEIITLKVAALADMMIGVVIWNPTYGSYEVISYDQEGQLIKVRKAANNFAPTGLIIPSCTKFVITTVTTEPAAVILPQVTYTAANLTSSFTTYADTALLDSTKKLNQFRVINNTDSDLDFSLDGGTTTNVRVLAYTEYNADLGNFTAAATTSVQMRRSSGFTASIGDVYIEGSY